MKKLVLLVLVLIFGLAACGGNDIAFSVEDTPLYKQGEASVVTVRAEQDGEPLQGLTLSGLMEMEKMDHGEIDINFSDNGDGTYTGEVELPISGEWILDLTSGDAEKILTINVGEG
ncbi:YtkA-like [Thalassobacillus cyri]|uniref:YtkA-like n=1 Tax=Thalassobacillus cyri TaxID=571932 RepID=A0A1H4HGS8_9BACI|nr:FixH family protein [Thalassobacillus cyri]SEB21013.1 YtkA-like [Thalassobacillus cyri]